MEEVMTVAEAEVTAVNEGAVEPIEDTGSVEATESIEECSEDILDPSVATGRNCRINIADKHEIVRLNQELQDMQHWFEDYGRNGLLFPNSIINGYFEYSQAA